MSRAAVIARRELVELLLLSPIAYVAMGLFLLAAGFSFWDDFVPGQPAMMRSIFEKMVWALIVVVPVLCMGLLSQEWATGTIETLMTAPINETEVVLGQVPGLAGVLRRAAGADAVVRVTAAAVRPSGLSGRSSPATSGCCSSARLFIAISLFCSSITRSQVVAAVSAAAVLLLTTIVPVVRQQPGDAHAAFGAGPPTRACSRGTPILAKASSTPSDLIFFIVVTGVFLFLTVKVLESRRWK